jgi:hypothetical protein
MVLFSSVTYIVVQVKQTSQKSLCYVGAVVQNYAEYFVFQGWQLGFSSVTLFSLFPTLVLPYQFEFLSLQSYYITKDAK